MHLLTWRACKMRSDILNENSAKYGGNVQNVVFVTDAATSTILANDSGKIHVMPDLTADCTIKLHAEKVGLSYCLLYTSDDADE